MKVYVATRGCYSDRFVQGVYATPDLAMAANPGNKWTESSSDGSKPHLVAYRDWCNDLDWDDYCCIDESELIGA